MRSLQYKYYIYFFIICLKCIKLHQVSSLSSYLFHKKDRLLSHQTLISIYTIMNTNNLSIQKKRRIHYIINSYSAYNKKQHNMLINKYIAQFIYQYKKYNTYLTTQSIKINSKRITLIHTIGLIYIYTIYKTLNARNPLFIYYYLTRS